MRIVGRSSDPSNAAHSPTGTRPTAGRSIALRRSSGIPPASRTTLATFGTCSRDSAGPVRNRSDEHGSGMSALSDAGCGPSGHGSKKGAPDTRNHRVLGRIRRQRPSDRDPHVGAEGTDPDHPIRRRVDNEDRHRGHRVHSEGTADTAPPPTPPDDVSIPGCHRDHPHAPSAPPREGHPPLGWTREPSITGDEDVPRHPRTMAHRRAAPHLRAGAQPGGVPLVCAQAEGLREPQPRRIPPPPPEPPSFDATIPATSRYPPWIPCGIGIVPSLI